MRFHRILSLIRKQDLNRHTHIYIYIYRRERNKIDIALDNEILYFNNDRCYINFFNQTSRQFYIK
jgi:hypothetical protein